MDIDFGYGASSSSNNAGEQGGSDNGTTATNIDTGNPDNNKGGENITDISDDEPNKNKPSGQEGGEGTDKGEGGEGADNNAQPAELTEGTTIDVDGQTYTVDKDGNVLDGNGNIFKEKSEVQNWIASFEQVDDNPGDINIASIQEAIGVDITDDNDKPIEFDNTPDGIKAYVDAVIETAKQEHFETAINTLYSKYPVIKDVLDYYIANGNSLEGFGQVQDRSGITVDDTNEAQQEAIIRTAWAEQGRKGDVESYIQYLKSSGILATTAKEELAGLQEADAQYKEQLAQEAQQREQEQLEQMQEYWNGVKDVIDSRKIAGYQIPDNIIINRNGQKLSVTPNDFFAYLYQVDDNGQSAYYKDLAAETLEQRRDDEILRAYLKFVGGNYSNLVDMAINEDKVKTLKLRAKERSANAIRINRPKTNTTKGSNIDLGYN